VTKILMVFLFLTAQIRMLACTYCILDCTKLVGLARLEYVPPIRSTSAVTRSWWQAAGRRQCHLRASPVFTCTCHQDAQTIFIRSFILFVQAAIK